ncbi:gamma-glutamylcyclotransferase family protein [Proteiniborus sp. MB09-C3]|uniref:gamma-glutamylcyclotransferase family protein n=1 Tax=Proteiniborus sp. MB09-C3 TaxID=3050072 RepID=UPI0025540CC5|nr:gamma-glutamylcyclotransferase family protein [Proteiniborus sp. MB09-C3]WIV13591.1 gamma-glutamylcyclotransferase family protein [Proteiniborus sp. MB09-C3]
MKNNKSNESVSEILYIAYGSNLNLSQMKQRCPTARVIGVSEIKDYELVFRGSRYSSVATIEPCQESSVPVLLWGIQPEDEKSLDRYEGYPNFYEKENMEIVLNGRTVSAMVYVMTPGHELGIPSERYKISIEDGYMDAGFDADILQNAVDKIKVKMEDEMNDIGEQESLFGMKWW